MNANNMKFNRVKVAAAAIIGLSLSGVFGVALRAQDTAQVSRSVWDGVYTQEQSRRGEAFYGRDCAKCHGTDLAGADEVPALSGGAFLSNWDGLTVGDLSERVRISMPPNKQGSLTRQQIVDILSYVLNVNSFPAGKTELDSKTELLKQIRIEATRPKAKSGSN
jgi:mono/diheme cytochrome c family protein